MVRLHLILLLAIFLVSIKHQTLKNLHKHLGSILYVCSFNLLYYILCKDYILWDFKPKKVNSIVIRIIHLLFIMPLIVLLYLEHIPSKKGDQFIYIVKWVTSSAVIEYIGQKVFKMIYFDNGWHMGWSICIYAKMYLFSILFKKYPLSILTTSFGFTAYLLYKFKVPLLSNLKEYWLETKRLVQLDRMAIVTIISTIFCIFSVFYYFRKNKTLRFR